MPPPSDTTDVVLTTPPAASGRLPRRDAWLLGLAAAWAGVVLAVYLRHAWALLSGAEGRWVWPEVGQTLRYTGLPHAHEALLRAGSGIGAASVCALAVLGLGVLVARVIAPRPTSVGEWLILRVAAGAGSLGSALSALAGLGLYTPGTVRALILVLAAATCVLALASLRRARTLQFTLPRARDWLWVVVTVGTVLYAGFCALAPEVQYDALWYHLELPRRWLASGHAIDDVNDYVSLYPLGWDLLFGAALTLDGPVAAKLLHWMMLPACGAVAGLLARMSVPRASPWLAAAIFVTAPTVFWEATTAYIDLALALYVGVAIYALLRAHETDDHRWLGVAGLHLGFACATKHLGLVALAAILPVFAWSRLHMPAGGGRRASGGTRSADGGRATGAHAPAVGAAALALAIVTVLALLVPLPCTPRLERLQEPGVSRHVSCLRRGASRTLGCAHRTRPSAVQGSLRPPPHGGTRAGVAVGHDHPRRPVRRHARAAAPCRPANHDPGGHRAPARRCAGRGHRHLFLPVGLTAEQLPAPIPGAAVGVVRRAAGGGPGAGRREAARARGARGRAFTVGAVLLVSLPPWTVFHEGDRRGWNGWLTHAVHEPPTAVVLGGISDDAWLRAEVRTYGAWQWLNTHVPPGGRVLTFFSGDQLYSERARIWSEAVNARAATWGATTGHRVRVQQALRRLGVSYVLAPAAGWQTAEHRRLDLLRPGVMGPALERVYDDRFTVIYAVRAEAGEVAGTIDHSYGR